MQEEIWKDVPGYEGLYQVSSLGRVKSLKFGKEKILSNRISLEYYAVVLLKNNTQKTFKVHSLVSMAFLERKLDGTNKIVTDHINNNPLDNRLENLQIITQRENASKDQKNGTSKYTGVSLNKLSNKWRARIQINRKNIHLGIFKTEEEASIVYQNKLKEINGIRE